MQSAFIKEDSFKVLIVDPEEGPREAFRMIFRVHFPEVHLQCVNDGRTALKELEERQYDLLLIESNRVGDGLRGVEVVRLVRKRRPQVWCASMTAYDPHISPEIESELSLLFTLPKPFDLGEFVALMRRLIRLRHEFNGLTASIAFRPA